MRRAAEDSYGPPAKFHKSDVPIPQARHCLKVLLPSDVVGRLLDAKAAAKVQIQNDTGTKLFFSNRDDYYPGTRHRVLGIYSDDSASVDAGCGAILNKLIEYAEDGSRKGEGKGDEVVGKEAGEYIFRVCITASAAGVLIGSGGSNISKLRSESGSKVFIDHDRHLGHRLVRVVGGQKELSTALPLLNEYVQAECDSSEFWSSYSSVINFGASGGEEPAAWEPKGKGKGGKGADKGSKDEGSRRKGGGKGGKPEDSSRKGAPQVQSDSVEEAIRQGLDLLADKVRDLFSDLPQDKQNAAYLLDCKYPAQLYDKLQSFVQTEIREALPDIIFDFQQEEDANGECSVAITGTAPYLYAAHAQLMQRIACIRAEEEERLACIRAAEEEEARRKEERQAAEGAEALRRQIAELQNQLKQAKTSKW